MRITFAIGMYWSCSRTTDCCGASCAGSPALAAAAAALLLVAAGVALIGALELLLSELLTCAAFKVEKNSSCKSSNN